MENPSWRMDSDFFQKRFLQNIAGIESFSKGWVRLGDAVKELTGGATPLGADYPEQGVRFLRVQNIMPNFIDDSDLVCISPKDDETLSRSRLKENDVLLTITGVSYGKSAVVTSEFAGSNINQHSVRMELLTASFNPFFISTFLNSRIGKLQSDQNITGIERPALDYETIHRFRIPRVSEGLQDAIAATVQRGHHKFAEVKQSFEKVENLLSVALGLQDWRPPEPLTYCRQASDAFIASRIDAEFHRPKVDALRQALAKRFELKELSDLGVVDNGQSVPYDEQGEVPIIRSGDLSDLEDGSRFLRARSDKPIYKLEPGDVLVSSIGFGSIGKIQVFNKTGIYGTVSEVTVIRQGKLNPYFVESFLRSRFGQMQIDRYITGATGQLHLYKRDVGKIFLPIVPLTEQERLEAFAHEAAAARTQARALLAQAKRAVEIAIEKSEVAALKYLEKS